MRIIAANLSAVYSGRGNTVLAPYNRAVMLKADGSVSIHGDKGSKPLNYMVTSDSFTEDTSGEHTWTFTNKKDKLVITFHEIYDEINLELGTDEPGHEERHGTEEQLQEWLSNNLATVDSELNFIQREYQTGDGPVDILAMRGRIIVAVEVKREANISTVGQVLRYADALQERNLDTTVEAAIAGVVIKKRTAELAERRGVKCLQIPEDWLKHYQEGSKGKKAEAVPDIFKGTLFG